MCVKSVKNDFSERKKKEKKEAVDDEKKKKSESLCVLFMHEKEKRVESKEGASNHGSGVSVCTATTADFKRCEQL